MQHAIAKRLFDADELAALNSAQLVELFRTQDRDGIKQRFDAVHENCADAIASFARLPLFVSFARVTVVVMIGYGLLAALVGLQRMLSFLLPPMPPA